MAHVLNDRVKETSTSTGTGTINLAGAATGFETFVAGIGNSNTTYYSIVHQTADEWEVGLGTVTDASPDTLSRTPISSSNSDSAVDFTSGTKDVFCTLPASKAFALDNSGNASTSGSITGGSLVADNITIDSSTVSSTDTNGDINLTPNGTGKVKISNTSTSNTLELYSANTGSSTNPRLVLNRDSSSPAADDYIGKVEFWGKDSIGAATNYSNIFGQITNVTNGSEAGKIFFQNMSGGSLYTAATVSGTRLKAQYTGLYANHLASVTASDDATLALAGYMSNSYDIYDVYIEKFMPASNDVVCFMQMGNGGSYETQYYGYYNVHAGTGGSDGSQTDSRNVASGTGGGTSTWAISGQSEFAVGNESDEGFTAHIRLYHARDSATFMGGSIIGGSYFSVDGYMVHHYLSTLRGNFGNTITDVKVYFSSGNITSGSMHLYGLYVG